MECPDKPSYEAIKGYLFSLKNRGSKYGIERMELLANAIGHPEEAFPSIHISGTNGKGSTAAILESIYRHAGYKTGLFTSPHLVYLGERIQVNRELLSPEKIITYTQYLKEIAAAVSVENPDNHPSFFEFMTAMAFLHFAEEKIDVAIIETGLGGRLDSTNILNPELCIITSIGLDHTHILGDTLEEIAAEKAGILKENTPLVLGHIKKEAKAAIIEKAKTLGIHPVDAIPEEKPLDDPRFESNLKGRFQRFNTATALKAIELMTTILPVPDKAIKEGLNQVHWEGRWDLRTLEREQTLILDTTHNQDGIEALKDNLENYCRNKKGRLLAVVGVLGHDRAAHILPLVSNYADEIHLVVPRQERATSTNELEAHLEGRYVKPIYHSTIAEIFPNKGLCHIGNAGDTILTTGSIYLVGEIIEAISGKSDAPEFNLQDSIHK